MGFIRQGNAQHWNKLGVSQEVFAEFVWIGSKLQRGEKIVKGPKVSVPELFRQF